MVARNHRHPRTQLELSMTLTHARDELSRDPTSTRGKIEVTRRMASQRVHEVLESIEGVHLTNKTLIHLLNFYAWPYNRTLLDLDAIRYLDHRSENTLQRAIDIERPKFTRGDITFSALLGNIQKNIQESEEITIAPRKRDGQQ